MPTNRNLIWAEWESFRAKVLHPESPPDQVREMKVAFYGGVAAGLNAFFSRAEDDVSGAGLAVLHDLGAELDAFREPMIEELDRAIAGGEGGR
jgi:hypothetical protein